MVATAPMPHESATSRELRQAVGLSLAKTAALADVSEPTARIFEIDPEQVRDVRKREALQRVYDGFRAQIQKKTA